ncbi:unnamed protein product [Schistosoma margrebowiei]|uniref:Uncharacterized protein n=1 Tax=Schistosoma margrebowiei TaxID=48269 RepID=A0A183NCB5_9TREM|nr:unnamed protein product [Schistosoma margrebowiei]
MILRYNTACTNLITTDGEDLEDVKTFTYLESIIDEHGGSDAHVKARIGKARTAYLQLKNIWNSKQLSVNQHLSQDFQYKYQDGSTV